MLEEAIKQFYLSDEVSAENGQISLSAAREKPLEPEWEKEQGEGELAVDIIETSDAVVIVAPMAGTAPADIELHLQNDCLTIRGKRRSPVNMSVQSFHEECFWGNFSRTIVLPFDVQAEEAQSEYRHGVLTVTLPKARKAKSIPLLVVDE